MSTAIAHYIDVQDALTLNEDEPQPPSSAQLESWANAVLVSEGLTTREVTLRLVQAEEMTDLNKRYRDKSGTTNVLSFPFQMDIPIPASELQAQPLGDVVICHEVVCLEAKQQKKPLEHHYAHMVTHGMLHLCGYDHLEDSDADIMEAREIELLATFNVPNPYVAD